MLFDMLIWWNWFTPRPEKAVPNVKIWVAGSSPAISTCSNGGTGRPDRLKICCPKGRVGSNPTWSTFGSVGELVDPTGLDPVARKGV